MAIGQATYQEWTINQNSTEISRFLCNIECFVQFEVDTVQVIIIPCLPRLFFLQRNPLVILSFCIHIQRPNQSNTWQNYDRLWTLKHEKNFVVKYLIKYKANIEVSFEGRYIILSDVYLIIIKKYVYFIISIKRSAPKIIINIFFYL